jgi:peptidoglycan hydrolase-like protein with peptidoglycan-binding domain
VKITNDLKKGTEKSSEVFELQYKLHMLCYYHGRPESPIDGSFGEETENAVKKFQQDHGLQVTGIIDQTTADAIDDAYRRKITASSYEATTLGLNLDRMVVYHRFQEQAMKNLAICTSISPIAIEYDKLLKAQGYNERERAGMIAEQAVHWGNAKGINMLSKLLDALKPALESISGLTDALRAAMPK